MGEEGAGEVLEDADAGAHCLVMPVKQLHFGGELAKLFPDFCPRSSLR